MPDESAFREMIRQYNEQLFAMRPPAAQAAEPGTKPSAPFCPGEAASLRMPGRYMQGCGALSGLGRAVGMSGEVFCLTGSAQAAEAAVQSLQEAGLHPVRGRFGGECTPAEVERIQAQLRASGCGLLAGIGGGKLLDTAKAAAAAAHVPVIMVPTAASAAAACSSFALLHTEDGRLKQRLPLPSGPLLVLADTAVIAAAPPRLLAAGMGNALAVWSGAQEKTEAAPLTAKLLAQSCGETVLRYGRRAMLAAERGACTRALEAVVEACLFQSAAALENGGHFPAHAILCGLAALPETRTLYSGEKAAFAALVQLLLANAPDAALEEAVRFCLAAGLPVTLGGLGLAQAGREQLEEAARQADAASEMLCGRSLPPGAVLPAILEADALGEAALKRRR